MSWTIGWRYQGRIREDKAAARRQEPCAPRIPAMPLTFPILSLSYSYRPNQGAVQGAPQRNAQ